MLKRLAVFCGVALAFYAGSGPTQMAQIISPIDSEKKFRPGELIVEVKPGASISDVNLRNQTTTMRRVYGTNYYRLQLPPNVKEDTWLEQLKADPAVLDASRNPVVTSPFTSLSRSIMSFPDGYVTPGHSEEEYNSQLDAFSQLMKLRDAHLRSTGEGVVIAVIDTGVDLKHRTLTSRIWTDSRVNADIAGDGIDNDNDGLIDDYRGWDFVSQDNDPKEVAQDPHSTVAGHGTFIAGLIAQVAPGSRIMPIRAFTPIGESDVFTISEAIKYAADHNALVFNLSFGSPVDTPILRDAINYAKRKSALVAAAGNEDTSQPPQYPANLTESVIGVAAVEMNDLRAYFSNYGSSVSLNSPGYKLISTYPGGGYAEWSGTSFSTPLVVSEAALTVAFGSGATESRLVIEDSALSIDELNPAYQGLLGNGRIRPLEALQSLILNPLTGESPDYRSHIELIPITTGTLITGEAAVLISGEAQELHVSAQGLSPRSKYKILINGIPHPAGLMTSSSFGAIDTILSNQASGNTLLPDPIDPVTEIRQVELRNEKGDLVAVGIFHSPAESLAIQQTLHKEARLLTLGTQSAVTGKAKIDVDSVRESLSLAIEGLVAGSVYTVVVDGISLESVGALTKSIQPGFAKIAYTSDGSSGHLLVNALSPAINIRTIKIFNPSGQLIAEGNFRSDIDGISANSLK